MPTKKVADHRDTPFTSTMSTPTKPAPESDEVPIEILMEVKQNKEEEQALPTKQPTVKPSVPSLPDTIAHLRAAIQDDEDEEDTQNEINMIRKNVEEEKKKAEEEKKRKEEEERKRKEEEERKRMEEERKRKEEERKRMEEKRKAEEERKRKEEESKKQQEERDRQQQVESKPPSNVIARLRANSLPDDDDDTPSMTSLLRNALQKSRQSSQQSSQSQSQTSQQQSQTSQQQSQTSQQQSKPSSQQQSSPQSPQAQNDSKTTQSHWPETKKSRRKGKKRSRRSMGMQSPVARIRSFAEIRYEAGNSKERLRRSAAKGCGAESLRRPGELSEGSEEDPPPDHSLDEESSPVARLHAERPSLYQATMK